MRSTLGDLQKRGYITKSDLNKYEELNCVELKDLYKSSFAMDRTCAIELLSKKLYIDDPIFFSFLIQALQNEKALYTRIRICEKFEKGTTKTAKNLIPYLGTIGNNQYNKIPNKGSNKKSYPLQRDIIARTLSRMDISVFNEFLEVLNDIEIAKLSELIDSIGYMVFYNPVLDTKENLEYIMDIINKYKSNDLIIWKCITCLSAFNQKENIIFLQEFKNSSSNPVFISECDRSLNLLKI